MNQEVNRRWNVYISTVAGLALGVEVLSDNQNKWAFGVQLFILRFLITRDSPEEFFGD